MPIDRPVTLEIEGVDLCSGLTLIAAPHDLAFEYRYGVLFLTTAEHAQDERDPTGVGDIRPPPNSPLARAWNEPCIVAADESPLNKTLQSLGQPLAIGFDLSALPARGVPLDYPVTKSLKNLPFQHALALILNDIGLRCEARGDDTIVILAK